MTDTNPEYKANKFNKGKPMISLVEPNFIEGMAKILTMGAEKYGLYNWKQGISEAELIDAMERHIIAYRKGEKTDKQSKLDHRLHAACNLMFWEFLYPVEEDTKCCRDSTEALQCINHSCNGCVRSTSC